MPRLEGAGLTPFEALLARADAGEPEAACEVAIALIQCRLLARFGGFRVQVLSAAAKEAAAAGNLPEANAAANALRDTHSRQRICQDMPALAEDLAGRYLRQAALAGAPEAVIRYANAESLGFDLGDYRAIGTPAFDAWRREAPGLIEQAFQSGRPEVVLMQVSVRGSQAAEFGTLMPPDDRRDYAMLRLARRLFGNDPALVPYQLPTGLDAEERAAAEALAVKWHDDYFDGRRYRLAEHTASLLPAYDLWPDPNTPWPTSGNVSGPACGTSSR